MENFFTFIYQKTKKEYEPIPLYIELVQTDYEDNKNKDESKKEYEILIIDI